MADPLPTSYEDVLRDVEETVAGSVGTYDSPAIARAIVARWGLVPVADLDRDAWWDLVLSHEVQSS